MLLLLKLYFLITYSPGVFAACVPGDEPPTFTWPFGRGIDQFEINTQSWNGSAHGINYSTGPPDLGYDAIAFDSSNQTYVNIRIPDHTITNTTDFGFIFNIYPETDGVFFHYKSDEFDNPSGTFLQSFKLSLNSGTIKTFFSDGSIQTMSDAPLGLTYNSWHFLGFVRDMNHDKVIFMYEGIEHKFFHDSWILFVPPKFPGILRIGGSLDNDSFFTGKVSCIQLVPCKGAKNSYNSECNTMNWIQYTSSSTTTTTTTTSTTQSTTTLAPTTTTSSTTVSIPSTPATTMSIPSKNATSSTTMSSPSTAAASSTTMSTPFTTATSLTTISTPSTAATTSTILSTPSTTTSPTPILTTSTAITASTTQSATTTLKHVWLLPSTTPFEPFEDCSHYQVLLLDAAIDQSSSSVLSTLTVLDVLECSKRCSQHGECESFEFNGGLCRLSEAYPTTMFAVGSVIYNLS